MTSLAKQLHDFSQIMLKIEENNGEISDDILPVLSHLEMSIVDKIDNYVDFYDAVKAQLERTKKVIDSFKAKQKSLENLESRLKDNVKHTMDAHSLTQIDGNERSIKLLNAGGVQSTCKPDDMFIQEETINPKYVLEFDQYIEEKLVYVIKDKEKFKEAVKQNRFHSCFLLPRGKYVRFS